jgi:hypothetical protein
MVDDKPPEPVTISLGKLWKGIREQSFLAKIIFWGLVVYTASTFLPWIDGPGVHWNAWDIGFLTALANVVVLAGLAVHLGGLAGIGPGSNSARWLSMYRYALPYTAVVLVIDLLRGCRGIGTWLALLGFAAALHGYYKLLAQHRLLPFRITK